VASEPPATESVVASPTPESATNANVLYKDDFTNPATSWPEAKFDFAISPCTKKWSVLNHGLLKVLRTISFIR
jgi:hypothetical protein